MGYYSEQEANKYLQKKIYDSQSRYQSRAIPIPRFPPPANDSNINFMGRAVSALLRMTDASTTIYSPECGGWFLRDGTEVMGISLISLLRTSISIPGLLGVDSLLSFRIVNELRQLLKFYDIKVKTYGVLLEQIRDGLFPEWKNIEDNGRLYTAAMKKVRLSEERSDNCILHSSITNNLQLVASLLASPLILTLLAIRFAHRSSKR